jgi:hypothetical protein
MILCILIICPYVGDEEERDGEEKEEAKEKFEELFIEIMHAKSLAQTLQ